MEGILSKEKFLVTQAIRFLRENQVEFIEHPYRYEERGGTKIAAKALGVDEHLIVKTLVMEDEKKSPLIILMHGDREVSTKALARLLEVQSITPCSSGDVFKHTGYKVGGISPFGMRKRLPIYIEETILSLPRIFINAGRKGLLCEMSPKDLVRVINPVPVHVAR